MEPCGQGVIIQVLGGKSHKPAFEGQFKGCQEELLLLSCGGKVAADPAEALGSRNRLEAA